MLRLQDCDSEISLAQCDFCDCGTAILLRFLREKLATSKLWFPEGPRIEKIQSRQAILKKSSFQYGMDFSIENGLFIPSPSLTAEKQGPGLKFSSENEIFKPRMKISSENGSFVRGGMPKGPSRTKFTTDSKFTIRSKFATAIVKHYSGHFDTTFFKGKLSSKSLHIVKDYGSSKTLRNWAP